MPLLKQPATLWVMKVFALSTPQKTIGTENLLIVQFKCTKKKIKKRPIKNTLISHFNRFDFLKLITKNRKNNLKFILNEKKYLHDQPYSEFQ